MTPLAATDMSKFQLLTTDCRPFLMMVVLHGIGIDSTPLVGCGTALRFRNPSNLFIYFKAQQFQYIQGIWAA